MSRAPAGTKAWLIRYRSIAENGQTVEITGVVIAPMSAPPEGGRKVVAWAHATVGVAEACAPSLSPTLFDDIAALKRMTDRGYVVVATDFQGLGTPGPSPYLVGVSSAHAVLDSVRAARAIPDAHVGKDVVGWGESQGAHAQLWVAKLAHDYAPDLDLLGVAAAAPPTDLVHGYDKLNDVTVRALLTAYTSAPWSEIYNIPLSTFANWMGRYLIHRIAGGCVRLDPFSTLTKVGLLVLSHQIPQNLGDPWTPRFRQNSVDPQHLDVPLLIAQGSNDHIVIPSVTLAFAKKSCAAGNAIRFVAIKDGDHTTIASRSQDQTLEWIAERFDHKPPPSDCATVTGEIGSAD